MNNRIIFFALFFLFSTLQAQEPVDLVNLFIGTSNYGTTNPGAQCPNGLMNVSPFNVMGSEQNAFDKDKQWWSTPYSFDNSYLTGFAHVNLSGVGCPDMGSLLLMPTMGKLDVDYKNYGSLYSKEEAKPGYYSTFLTKHKVKVEATATMRTGLTKFTFPKGQANILLNLGEGLTNESGATTRIVNDMEIEGSKLLGTFCYNPDAVFRIYFVMRVNKKPQSIGYWKKQRKMSGVEAEWDIHSGKYKIYDSYRREMSGDDIGVWLTYDLEQSDSVEVQIGVSFVSIENARENLDKEQPTFNFSKVYQQARNAWNRDLSRIKVYGGTKDQQTIFYSAMYHLLIHPNILQDVNGAYPKMGSLETGCTKGNRYTVYSLWDTYRNVHPLLSLVYPERQLEMVHTILDMYQENGWLPKWELYGKETYTMEGDPSLIVLNDTWQRGIRDFDTELALEAMKKGADSPSECNLLRPDNDDYLRLGYVPLRQQYDNSVSHALEYYIADWNLGQFAKSLGYHKESTKYLNRAKGYKNYYSKDYGTLRPILPNGVFYTPFNPLQGLNFEPSPGFHEGNAWNYTFYVPHDIMGLVKLMGGQKKFVKRLWSVFENKYFDMANEPDIAYPYLFSYFPKEAWRTQYLTQKLLKDYFHNAPKGLPGNDDTGTMSAWALFTMMGFYPTCPGNTEFLLTSPFFNRIEIELNPHYYPKKRLVIEVERESPSSIYIEEVKLGTKPIHTYKVDHKDLVKEGLLKFKLRDHQ